MPNVEPISDEELAALRRRIDDPERDNADWTDHVVCSLIARIDAEKARVDRVEGAFRAFCEGLEMQEVAELIAMPAEDANTVGKDMARAIKHSIGGRVETEGR